MLIGPFVYVDRSDQVLQSHTALSLALEAGNQRVRLMFGLVVLFNISIAFWGVVGTHAEEHLTAAISMVIGLVVRSLLLGNQRSVEFFKRSAPPEY